MPHLKHVVLLLILLPATCLAASPQPVPEQNTSSPASSPAQAIPSVPADSAVSEDEKCQVIGHMTSLHWYHATMCADRHKKLRPQEKTIKNMIASTYPAFHTVITTPPLSEYGKEVMTNLPYLPDRNPMLTEDGCKMILSFLEKTVNDSKTRQAILQCWEKPRPTAQENPTASQ